ncbi:MAG: acylphosphatase [Pseudomonadales bacterium]|nr:acylphosphatase [Pseudomonadales bacterium]
MARTCLTGLVKGRVQGVFFRAETQAEAQRLGLTGWVRNTREGHVEVKICGEMAALEAMRGWLQQGPPRARVDSLELVTCDDPEVRASGRFEIRY